MKNILINYVLLLLTSTLSIAQTPDSNEPRYGSIKKSKKYIKSDNKFIETMVKEFGSRDMAAKFTIGKGWEYILKHDLTTAMHRFNQAWLLDSTLTEVYWGFGCILTAREEYSKAIPYLLVYYNSNPQDNEVIKFLAICYFNHAISLKNSSPNDKWLTELNATKFYLKKYISKKPDHAYAYGQLALAYYHENKLDSAKHYGLIANKLDPSTLHPGFKKAIEIE